MKKNKEKKEKNNKEKKLKMKAWVKGIILIIIVFSIAGTCLFLYGKLHRKKDEPVNVTKIKETIVKYGYSLNDNVTKYYDDEFHILKDIAYNEATTEEEIAKQVAKLFVIDLYSMNYKINKYEVTSSQYYYSDKQEMFKNKVVDKLYNLMEDNAYDDRNQKLPEVTNVEVDNYKKSTYKMGEEKKDSYEVELTITYKEDMGYDKKGIVTLVKDGENNISVVSYKKSK